MISTLFSHPEQKTVVLSTLEGDSMFVLRVDGVSFRFNEETNEFHPFNWRFDSGVLTLSFDSLEYKMKAIDIDGDIMKCKVQSYDHVTRQKDVDEGEFEVISRDYEYMHQFPALREDRSNTSKAIVASLLTIATLALLFIVFS